MTAHLFKGCAAVICDPHSVLRDVDLLVEGPRITAIGKGLIAPSGADVIDARGWFLYPGLVNTHHHFFQTFVRNRADLDWTQAVGDPMAGPDLSDLFPPDRGLLLPLLSHRDGRIGQAWLHHGL